MRNFLLTIAIGVLLVMRADATTAKIAHTGDTVKVHYQGNLNNGKEFDSSFGGDPLEFKVGSGMVIEGFDSAVMGMKIGEEKTVVIPVEQAYGPYDDTLIQEVPRSSIPGHVELEIGKQIYGSGSNGQPISFKIIALKDKTITLDGNHPLAGEELTFKIKLVEIV